MYFPHVRSVPVALLSGPGRSSEMMESCWMRLAREVREELRADLQSVDLGRLERSLTGALVSWAETFGIELEGHGRPEACGRGLYRLSAFDMSCLMLVHVGWAGAGRYYRDRLGAKHWIAVRHLMDRPKRQWSLGCTCTCHQDSEAQGELVFAYLSRFALNRDVVLASLLYTAYTVHLLGKLVGVDCLSLMAGEVEHLVMRLEACKPLGLGFLSWMDQQRRVLELASCGVGERECCPCLLGPPYLRDFISVMPGADERDLSLVLWQQYRTSPSGV
ncbi:uncharacterized protein B0I36DRAFT_316170, partial [Microdochium trichocladiopsis]